MAAAASSSHEPRRSEFFSSSATVGCLRGVAFTMTVVFFAVVVLVNTYDADDASDSLGRQRRPSARQGLGAVAGEMLRARARAPPPASAMPSGSVTTRDRRQPRGGQSWRDTCRGSGRRRAPRRIDADARHPCRRGGDAETPEPPPSDTSDIERELLDSPCDMDVARYELVDRREPTRHASLADLDVTRLAVAIGVFKPKETARILDKDAPDDAFRCAILMSYLSVKLNGKLPGVDFVVVHSNLSPEDVAFIEGHGMRVVEGYVPPVDRYDSEFDAAALIKINVAALTDYDRVLMLDMDMFAVEDLTGHFTAEFAESLLTSGHSSSPVSGNWLLVRPDRRAFDLMRRLAENRDFTTQRGWAGAGLMTWPNLPNEPGAPCNAGYLNNDECRSTEFWKERCRRYRVTNWVHIGVEEVQGLFWYVYNISGHGTVRTIETRSELGQGLPWWWHMQGGCKPWIFKEGKQVDEEWCVRAQAWWWYHLWEPAEKAVSNLREQCPSFGTAFDAFNGSMKDTAASRRTCFWKGDCYNAIRPDWAPEKQQRRAF